jgi:hypothetical protein
MAAFPTLKEITATYQQIAYKTAPVKDGLMRNTLKASYKKLSGSKYGEGSYEFDLTSKAKYFKFWNDPHTSKSRTYKRPQFNFAIKAASAPQMKKLIDNYVKGEIGVIVNNGLNKEMAAIFKNP